ncbi:MAG: hypothetical protein EPN48_11740 [Microbacteriaceae bacterium]|nr:MAG: hypothetical protein EPN48_11740 [Microbacteriaceae bacterium]
MPKINTDLGIWIEHDTTSLSGGAFKGGVVNISSRFAHDKITIPAVQFDQFIDELAQLRDTLKEAI